MRKKRLWFFFLFAITACIRTSDNGDNEFTVSGQLEHGEHLLMMLEELTTSEIIPLDSACTDEKGRFEFRRQINDAGFYIMRLDEKNSVTLLIEPGESIEVSGAADELVRSYTVTGSEGSVLLSALYKMHWQNMSRVDSLVKILREKKYEDDFPVVREEINRSFAAIFKDQQDYVKQFIEDNPHSLASVIALYQYFGSKLLLKESEHFGYFEMLSKNLSESYPYNKHVMDLKRRVSEYKRTEEQRKIADENLGSGNTAPEIILPDIDGNQVALSSLRGKYVLIDFWAAWCPPCRQANRHLKKLYDEFNSQGFEIYGVSLDRTAEQWKKGIEEDEVDWIQVSDLRFWSSPVVSLYNVEAIPHTVLIDREGKIINRGLNPREVRDTLRVLMK